MVIETADPIMAAQVYGSGWRQSEEAVREHRMLEEGVLGDSDQRRVSGLC